MSPLRLLAFAAFGLGAAYSLWMVSLGVRNRARVEAGFWRRQMAFWSAAALILAVAAAFIWVR